MASIEHKLKDLDRASMKIIETIGIRLHHERMLDIAAENGIRVEDGKVFFTEAQLKEWISYAPSEFTLFARNPEHDMHIGGDSTVHASCNSGFPFIADLTGTRRSALFSDYINFVKLVHETPFFHINGGVMVTPEDLPNDEALYPRMLFATLCLSDKCLFGGMGGKIESEMTMALLMAAFETDKEGLAAKPRIANLVSTLSPLQYDEKMLDTLMVYAEHGQPVIISPAVMAGSTGPVTMAGTIAISNAESLVGVALSQMIRKGTPAIYGSATSGTDMRTGAFTIGSPESALAVKYCARLARMYGLPSRGGGTLNDAKNVSVQAGIESTMVQMVANQEKINFNFHSAGGLDTYGSMSYEKYAVDLDILGRIRFYLDDINTDEDSLALGPITEVGCGGQFLTNMHTAMNCRTAAFISDISLQGALKDDTSPDEALEKKMTDKVDKMLTAYQQPELSKDTVARLETCLTRFDVDVQALNEKMELI
ncbi:MAG: trimethylamine methyltransferase family protein [Desulfobacterales bacterium]|nr:trimethylamine methyltransferase family protein [Desulfobacterales bacterium]